MRILIIAAHPDDEVLGCGGTVAAFSGRHEIFTLIVTEGCSSQYADQQIAEMIQKKNQRLSQPTGFLA